MQARLIDIKRKQICPILHRHEWDYQGTNAEKVFFRLIISEMMRWQSRKGRGIHYDVLSSLISQLGAEREVDRLEISNIQLALKSFTSSSFYTRLDQVITNAEIQVGIANSHVITHSIPALGKMEDDICIITWDNDLRSVEDLRQAYETRLISIWSFYSLNRYPAFYNLFLDKDKIEYARYKPNQFYIRDSKSFVSRFNNIIEIEDVYPAPYEVCSGCNRRLECQTTRTKTKNSQRSW